MSISKLVKKGVKSAVWWELYLRSSASFAIMPSKAPDEIKSAESVLVTGANGFIASHVVSQLLDAGYHVLGTVRSESKITNVLDAHNRHENLDVCVVKDITDPSIFLAALETVKHLDAILHLAAPFSYSVRDYEQDLLLPAVRGTEAVLSIARHFHVRLVVHTNSFACIYDAAVGPAPEKTYTAADWSPLIYEDGMNATNAPAAYRAAKTVAEKTAWEYVQSNRDELGFEFVSLCPAMVFGSFLSGTEPRCIEDLNESNKIVWDVVRQGEGGLLPSTRAPVWVDVKDVAKAHVLALENRTMAGERLLLAAGVYCNQEIADVGREVCPKLLTRIPVGEPGRREAESHFNVDTRREAKMLDMEWRSLHDSLRDLIPQLFEIEKKGRL